MAARPKMPVPARELTPQDLCAEIQKWAEKQRYEFFFGSHATEYGKVVVRDPAGGFTTNTIPNPHHGRRLRRDQVRYVIQKLNARWKD